MGYNIKKKSDSNLVEDKNVKYVKFINWQKKLIDIIENGDSSSLVLFVRNNIQSRDFKVFLISMFGYVQSTKSEEEYESFVNVVKNFIPNLKEIQ